MKTQLLAVSFGRQLSSLKGNFLLGKTPGRLGRMLTFDAAAERYVEAPDANQLLTHSCRGAFVVPERA